MSNKSRNARQCHFFLKLKSLNMISLHVAKLQHVSSVEYMENCTKSKKKNIIKRRFGPPTPPEVCGAAVRMQQNKAAGVRRVGSFHKSLHKRALAVIHEGSRLIRDALGPPCLVALLLAYVIKMTPALQQLGAGVTATVVIC